VIANCTMPTIAQMIEVSGVTQLDSELTLTLHIDHRVNGTQPTEIEFAGVAGGNELRVYNLVTPPMAPMPPASPPMPFNPLSWGDLTDRSLGWMYRAYEDKIAAMQFGSYARLGQDTSSMCWSDRRGDTRNAGQFHTSCNGKGPTIYMATVIRSGVQYIVGGYTRQDWSGGGYATDSMGGLFQIQPVLHKYVSGDGPYSDTSSAIYKSNSYGPTFGAGHDWCVNSNMITGYVNFGHTYKCRVGSYTSNTCRNHFIGGYNGWAISESEVWSTN